MPPTPILISAGEASGDMYAAHLATALQQRADVALFGMGGREMRAAGVEIITDYSEVSVVGITEVLKRLPSLRRAMHHLVTEAQRRRPPLAILTDFPGFHLRLARKLNPLGIRNIYFICPQFWAWRPWRANLVRRRFTQALCIFPFEEQFYRQAGVNVKFIGHPLVGNVVPSLTRENFCLKHDLRANDQILTVLPGSRPGELHHHVPIIAAALNLIVADSPDVQVLIAVAPGIDRKVLESLFIKTPQLRFIENDTYNALASADVAIVSSGTATVEAALLGTPMVVVYRLSPLTARLAKPLIRTHLFAMVNLIAGSAVVPELIQEDFTAERLSIEALLFLNASKEGAESIAGLKNELARVRKLLGPPGAIDRAADAIIAQLHLAQSNAK